MTLDFLGAALLMAAILLNIHAILAALAAPGAWKLALATAIGLWVGLQIALSEAGFFQTDTRLQVPLIGIMVILPPLAVGLAAWRSAGVRTALLGLPLPLLVGLNVARLVGGFFLLLELAGRLDGPFPFFAGWGDIVVGVTALPLAMALARGGADRRVVRGWNLFGAADLLLAVTLGTLSTTGFIIQPFDVATGSGAVQTMPWLLIPTVLVPFYLILHAVIHARLRAETAKDPVLRAA